MMEYLSELWVDDKVRAMAKWIEKQEGHRLDELWFVIDFSGEDRNDGIAIDPKDYPSTWRLN